MLLPNLASTMYQSFEKNKPAVDYSAKSIAGGLAPPLAGNFIFFNINKFFSCQCKFKKSKRSFCILSL